jgi:hypothetical protein
MAWWSQSGGDEEWSHRQEHIWDSVTGSNDEAQNDAHLARLFNDTVFEHYNASTSELEHYLWDEYGIDFANEMDWEAWREWYEGG